MQIAEFDPSFAPDRFIGVVREGHPPSKGKVTPARYAAGRHIAVSRRGLATGLIDEALESLGLKREIAAIVGGFATALALALASGLIASVPERHTNCLVTGLHGFSLPVAVREIAVSLLWHPRMDADPAHRWLRASLVIRPKHRNTGEAHRSPVSPRWRRLREAALNESAANGAWGFETLHRKTSDLRVVVGDG